MLVFAGACGSGKSYAGMKVCREIDPDFELDVIAICCDFCEYESLAEFQSDYGDDYQSIEDITEQTLAIELDDGGIIIQSF